MSRNAEINGPLRAIFRLAKASSLFFLGSALLPMELLLRNRVRARAEGAASAVFVIGAPRSGTTLLYQLLINSFGFSYLTNLSARFPERPLATTWMARHAFGSARNVDYRSRFGGTSGIWGPSEAGDFWYRWFPRDHTCVAAGEIPSKAVREIAFEVTGMREVSGRIPVFKNTFNTMRLGPLSQAMPRSVFIVIRRDSLATASSILRARVKVNGNPHNWWSVRPPEYAELVERPYWEQIAGQLSSIQRQIEAGRKMIGASRFFDIQYERLCKNPVDVLTDLAEFFDSNGIDTPLLTSVGPELTPRRNTDISSEDLGRLADALASFRGSND